MVLTPVTMAVDVLLTITNLLTIFAIMGVYFIQAEQADTQGLIGFVLAMIGSMLAAPISWVAYLLGLLLLALTNRKTQTLTSMAIWLWFGGSLLSVIGVLQSANTLLGLGLIASGTGRILAGFELNNAWQLTPSQPQQNHLS